MTISPITVPILATLLVVSRVMAQLPELGIQRSGSQIVLSWPASAAGYRLQSTENLSASGSWQEVPGSYAVQGQELAWTNTFPSGTRFFRLARPGSLPTPTGALTGTIASMGIPWAVTTDTNAPGNFAIPGTAVGSVPKIVPFANFDGSLDVAWISASTPPRIVITHIVPDAASFKTAWHLKPYTLAYLGGFTRDEAGNMYYLTTVAEDLTNQVQPSRVQRPNIAQVVKLSPLGNELFRSNLRTDISWAEQTPIYSPMTWGTGKIAFGNGRIMTVFSTNTEFDPAVNSRHQWHIYTGLNADTGAVDFSTPTFGHSWDHRLIFHAGKFIGTSLGDAGLRGIGVANADIPDHRVAFAIKGGDAPTVPFYQNVFTRLGDLAPGNAGYGLLFSTEKTATYTGGTSPVISSRNIAFVHVRSDFDTLDYDPQLKYDVSIVDTNTGNAAAQTFDVPIKDYWGTTYAGRNKGLVWLTNYTNRSTENAERPHLVAIDGGRFIALWEKWSLTAYVETFAAVLDEYGNILKAPASLGTTARLHRQDSPIRFGNKAAWVVGESAGPRLVLYTLDAGLVLNRIQIN